MSDIPKDIGLRVCGDRVLLLVEEVETEIKTESGIVIAQVGKERQMAAAAQNVAYVVQVGSMAWNDMPEPWAKVGDKVCFGKYAGSNIYDPKSDKTYRLVADTDINAAYID